MAGERGAETSIETASSRILVVDDDHRNVRLMESILKGSGYPVIKAYDGEEALRLVATDTPDLILLDIKMPRLNGLELCQLLKGRYETRLLPIIMVTALNSLDDKVHALETGADDFLSKPINKAELIAKVRAILRVKSLQDEVERQRLELAAANDQLLQMQRFKESMTQMVVHDLKNPLSGIMGNLQLMQIQADELSAERREELLLRSRAGALHLMRMILNILQIAKLEENRLPLRREPMWLGEVVEKTVAELMSLSTRDGIVVERNIDPELPQVTADRELVERVIANLLSNALKHTARGGRIIIAAGRKNDDVVLSVSDTGEGIPKELLPHIFDRFVSGESTGDHRHVYNSGLGLTFCKLAVESHGGRIWIESSPGEGTTVSLTLSIQGDGYQGCPAAPGTPPETPGVDDVPGSDAPAA